MKCRVGKIFISSLASQQALENYLDTVISETRSVLFSNLVPLFSSVGHWLNSLAHTRFEVTNRIFEVDSRSWHLNFHDARGAYLKGKIFLKKGNWCRKTLYHESLHGVSVFVIPSVSRNVGQRHKFLSEGLTEFLAGYMLFKQHQNCYEKWKRGRFGECKISYKSKVKLWCSFCNFIKLEEVKKLYFWDGNTNWESRYSQFLTAIHNAGYPNFRDVLGLGGNSEIIFTQECIDNFGEDFQEILNSRKSLDYAHMIV